MAKRNQIVLVVGVVLLACWVLPTAWGEDDVRNIDSVRATTPLSELRYDIDFYITKVDGVEMIATTRLFCLTSAFECANPQVDCYSFALVPPTPAPNCAICETGGNGSARWCAPAPNAGDCLLTPGGSVTCGRRMDGTCAMVGGVYTCTTPPGTVWTGSCGRKECQGS